MAEQTIAAEIIERKREAGDHAVLWTQPDAGDVIIWACEADSENDDGERAVVRYHVPERVCQEIIDAGEADFAN